MTDSGRLFDDAGRLFEINPSKLQCYLDCPRQYRFRYIDRRPERRAFGPSALGRSVHKALRDFYALGSDERTLDNLLRCLRRAWDSSGYRGQKEVDAAFTRAEDMLCGYYAGADPRSVRVLALESKFSHAKSREGVLITGRIDRLDLEGDEYVIVDYKTGRFGATDDTIDASLPLSLYLLAASAVLRRDVTRIAVEHLPTGRRALSVRDRARVDGDWKAIVDIVDEIRAPNEFAPRPGPLCRWCDYLTACPEGQRHVQNGAEAVPVDRSFVPIPNAEPEPTPLPTEG